MTSRIKRALMWIRGVTPADLDRLAEARPIGQKWSDWAKRMSRRLGG